MTTRTRLALSSVLLVSIAGAASAGTISHADLPNGTASQDFTLDGVNVTVSASVRSFKSKTVNGRSGVGIAGGAVDGEIDGATEAIEFAFSEPVTIDALCVSFLYTDGNFGDVGDEVARFVTDLGDFTLIATTASSATWTSPSGAVSNISLGNNSGGGEWLLATTFRDAGGIFGGPITSLELRSGVPGAQGKFSDFAFVTTTFSASLPTPGAGALLGAAGLVAASRRRRAA